MTNNKLLRWFSAGVLLVIISITAGLTGCSAPSTTTTSPPATRPDITTQPPATQTATIITQPITSTVTTTAPATSSTTPSPSPSSSPSPTSEAYNWPTTIYTPEAASYTPTAEEAPLFQYMLELINADRQSAGLNPVILNYNSAAQKHAQDMLKNNFLAHWGTDGLKPYMRYTISGGLNYESENSAFSSNSGGIDVKNELLLLEQEMMAEVPPNDGHRTNILNKWHKKVSLGIAFDKNTVALVQQFEGDYVEFYQPPTITGKMLSLSGRLIQSGLVLNNVAVTFDPTPQPLTGDQLDAGDYHRYGLGKVLGQVFPPPPPNAEYLNLPANSIVAAKGIFEETGRFYLEANISSFLQTGPGVYTIVLVPTMSGTSLKLTNYSIFVK